MKTVGIIGGMSWESSLFYYKILNESVRSRLGGVHSADILMYSVEFSTIRDMQVAEEWEKAAKYLGNIAETLQNAGANFIIIATNTMHIVADAVEKQIQIPLIHIVDPTAEALIKANISKVGLLGTAYTIKKDFYKGRLKDKFGIETIVPNDIETEEINRIIFDELCKGIIKDSSRDHFVKTIDNLAAKGAQSIILGCTEIGILVRQSDTSVPLFDTTILHAKAAVEEMLS